MAIRFTVTYSSYVAQTLAAFNKTGSCRLFQECCIRSRFLCPHQKPEIESKSNFRPKSMYSTLACELLVQNCNSSPIGMGLISLLKTLVGVSRPSTLAISPLKAASIIPFLQGLRWLSCNKLILGSSARNVTAVDKGGRRSEREEMKGISEGLSGRALGGERGGRGME